MVEIQKNRKKRRKVYKSPVLCWNSYWEINNEDKNTDNKTNKSNHTLIMGQKVQNNNQ